MDISSLQILVSKIISHYKEQGLFIEKGQIPRLGQGIFKINLEYLVTLKSKELKKKKKDEGMNVHKKIKACLKRLPLAKCKII